MTSPVEDLLKPIDWELCRSCYPLLAGQFLHHFYSEDARVEKGKRETERSKAATAIKSLDHVIAYLQERDFLDREEVLSRSQMRYGELHDTGYYFDLPSHLADLKEGLEFYSRRFSQSPGQHKRGRLHGICEPLAKLYKLSTKEDPTVGNKHPGPGLNGAFGQILERVLIDRGELHGNVASVASRYCRAVQATSLSDLLRRYGPYESPSLQNKSLRRAQGEMFLEMVEKQFEPDLRKGARKGNKST